MAKFQALTDRTIVTTKRDTPLSQLTDGRGLYLKLFWDRSWHSWRFDFKSPVTHTRQTLKLGDYPAVGLRAAREAAQKLRDMIADGKCPAMDRKDGRKRKANEEQARERAALGLPVLGTFEAVAMELKALKWSANPKPGTVNAWSPKHAYKWEKVMRRHAFPAIGRMQVSEVRPRHLLPLLQGLEQQGLMEIARAVRQYIYQVFQLAVVQERCEYNPVSSLLTVLKTRTMRGNFASMVQPGPVAELMRKIRDHEDPQKAALLQLMAYTYQRPINVQSMRWEDLDLEGGRWVIPSAVMKRSVERKLKGEAHVVPLARQSVALLGLLKSVRDLEECPSPWVFPSAQAGKRMTHPINSQAGVLALRGLGYDKRTMTAHGFRAMARTMGAEILKLNTAALECQLAHSNGNALGLSYDRATYLHERTEAAQVWADYLDRLRDAPGTRGDAANDAAAPAEDRNAA